MKNAIKIFSSLLCITLLSGCIYNQFDLKKFPAIRKSNSFYEIKDDVVLAIRALNKDECKSYFGIDLVSKGYIALQMRIENRTPDTYIIRPSYLSLTLAEPHKIAKLLHYDTSLFVTTAGALSLIFWWYGTYWVGRTGYDMYSNNKKINHFINETSLSENDSLKIMPYEIMNKFIFISRYDFVNTFTLKLFNKSQRKALSFFITLN